MSKAINQLLADNPNFHGGGARSWAVDARLLQWIDDNVPEGARTLETGAGHSTVAFLTRSLHHTVVTPAEDELALIRSYCLAASIPLAGLVHHAGPSVAILPGLVGEGELDVVLIDGDHAFPVPALDWTYTADRLRVGGTMLVDDVQLRPCRILRDFLREEPAWEELPMVGRTAVFRKGAPTAPKGWFDQPWSAVGPWPIGGEPLAVKVQLLRVHLRLRTRLRKALARAR